MALAKYHFKLNDQEKTPNLAEQFKREMLNYASWHSYSKIVENDTEIEFEIPAHRDIRSDFADGAFGIIETYPGEGFLKEPVIMAVLAERKSSGPR